MNVSRSIIIVAIATMVLGSGFGSSDVVGQERERAFGNGRFLRRVFGESDKKSAAAKSKAKKSKAKAKKDASKNPKGKQPTLAVRPSTDRNASSAMPSRGQRPTPANSLSRTPARHGAGSDNSFTPRLPKQTDIGTTRSGERDPALVTKSTPTPTLGFGMLVEARGEKLVITRLAPKGNARKAGFKTGDVIIHGGGIDFESIEEFNQVSEALKDGDQLEFSIKRRGKEEKLLLPFGDPVEADANAEEPPQRSSLAKRPTAANRINTKDNFSFLPTNRESARRTADQNAIGAGVGNSSGLKSVLGNRIAPSNPSTANPTSLRSADQWRSSNAINQNQMQRRLQQQQAEIERLRRQLQQREQNTPILGGPALSGPGGK